MAAESSFPTPITLRPAAEGGSSPTPDYPTERPCVGFARATPVRHRPGRGRRLLNAAALVSLALVSVCVAPSEAPAYTGPVGFYVKLGGAMSGHSLHGLDHYTQSWNDWLAYTGGNPNFRTLPWSPGAEVEVGYRFSDWISLGLGYSYVLYLRENSLSYLAEPGMTANWTDKLQARMDAFSGTVTIWVPPSRLFFIGGELGLGRGSLDEDVSLRLTAGSAEGLATSRGKFLGMGAIGGAFVGYLFGVQAGGVYGTIGYHFRSLGSFRGQFEGDGLDHSYRGFFGDQAPVSFDYSGTYVVVGLYIH